MRLADCLRTAHIDEYHVATGKKLGIRAEHRMDRGNLTARIFERSDALPQRGLQRAYVEDDAIRLARRELLENFIRDLERCCNDDEIVLESDAAPVREISISIGAESFGRPCRICAAWSKMVSG